MHVEPGRTNHAEMFIHRGSLITRSYMIFDDLITQNDTTYKVNEVREYSNPITEVTKSYIQFELKLANRELLLDRHDYTIFMLLKEVGAIWSSSKAIFFFLTTLYGKRWFRSSIIDQMFMVKKPTEVETDKVKRGFQTLK